MTRRDGCGNSDKEVARRTSYEKARECKGLSNYKYSSTSDMSQKDVGNYAGLCVMVLDLYTPELCFKRAVLQPEAVQPEAQILTYGGLKSLTR